MEDQKAKICTICHTELIGQYCHECGQKVTHKKLSLSTVLSDMMANIWSMEGTVLATMIHLIKDPFKVINNYWLGNRNYYHSPGKLVFYCLFIAGLHFAFLGNTILGMKLTVTNNMSPQIGFLLFFFPLLLIASYVTYFRRGYSFLKHFVAVIYIFSCWSIIFIIFDDLVRWLFGNILGKIPLLLFPIVLFVWIARIFSKRKKWSMILLNAMLNLLVYIVVTTIIVVALYFISPQSVRRT
ncbi:hypothetical protein QQ008_04045 [Fulvivirgaceae bacterium BMA10]|uniref:DUF3667 domain-containing protein n=1 Tax=Splendidivirga corallicola TaxID=3051826 RepID=A0ABT8KII2_9BACT|nr:hypothetical protein [Fulvivirgaceae bacterium BMA10]